MFMEVNGISVRFLCDVRVLEIAFFQLFCFNKKKSSLYKLTLDK